MTGHSEACEGGSVVASCLTSRFDAVGASSYFGLALSRAGRKPPRASADGEEGAHRTGHPHQVHLASHPGGGLGRDAAGARGGAAHEGTGDRQGKLSTRGEAKRADYVLYHRADLPIAVVKARSTSRRSCRRSAPMIRHQSYQMAGMDTARRARTVLWRQHTVEEQRELLGQGCAVGFAEGHEGRRHRGIRRRGYSASPGRDTATSHSAEIAFDRGSKRDSPSHAAGKHQQHALHGESESEGPDPIRTQNR